MNLRKFYLMFISDVVKKNNIYIKNDDSKFCRNCKYYIERTQLDPYDNYPTGYLSKCEKFGVRNLVSGEIEFEDPNKCRNKKDMCGLKGIYFEPKNTNILN